MRRGHCRTGGLAWWEKDISFTVKPNVTKGKTHGCPAGVGRTESRCGMKLAAWTRCTIPFYWEDIDAFVYSKKGWVSNVI